MQHVLPTWPISTIPVAGEAATFPVRRIFCVGRNYEAHAREMGKDPSREPPFFFSKFPDAVVGNNSTIAYPPGTQNYHHEIELVVAIGREGFAIPTTQAKDYIYGYATGLDMTRRDLQLEARDKGRPWDTGKNFSESAPISSIQKAESVGHLSRGAIWLKVNDQIKQQADLADLIWSVDEIIEHLSKLYRLLPGDLIMTGTPAGVGPVKPGDRLVGHIDGLEDLVITIGEERR
jgi:fumarylpyruvate hydrolase